MAALVLGEEVADFMLEAELEHLHTFSEVDAALFSLKRMRDSKELHQKARTEQEFWLRETTRGRCSWAVSIRPRLKAVVICVIQIRELDALH